MSLYDAEITEYELRDGECPGCSELFESKDLNVATGCCSKCDEELFVNPKPMEEW